MPTSKNRVFLDIETTGLHPVRNEITEIAYIVRTPDGEEFERVLYPEHSLENAEDVALEMTRYHERIAPQPKIEAAKAIAVFLEDARGATLVGANPSFDATRLQLLAIRSGLDAT